VVAMTLVTKETLKAFRPQHEWFIGFDSDGCIFDSMELKHKECFIPNIIKHYNLQSVSKYARQAAEFVNLYSYWRGTNRFPALVKTFELLRDWPEVQRRNVALPDWAPIKQFIDTASALGNPALKDSVARTENPVLRQTLEWSEAVNRDIEAMVKGLPPFPLVRESLKRLQGRADMIVVSATPAEALRREWEEHEIDRYVALIAGQELGKKEEQLGLTASGKYAVGHMLMVGDALGDLKAARSAGALFYPVLPGREDESWKLFHEDVCEQFLAGKYTRDSEALHLAEFEKVLPKTAPWVKS
jgi:phosphoglycolate phosphatase-like HAD superfamily hydrolase